METRETRQKSLLCFTTTGSVDDGKSTLIGRMLYETDCIYLDQYDAVKKASIKRGRKDADLALLLDGLQAERQQGITIDVAYRYFSTDKRKFIIADTPGHEQYTRNMISGASNAGLAVILIDAKKGISTQSKRHGFILSLLQIPHLIVAVNKMDLVKYSQNVFDTIAQNYSEFSERLDIHDIKYIPVSALKGDNVVQKSKNMPWYHGPPLLEMLETIEISADTNLIDFRFPVQYVIRHDSHYRGYSGTILSGTIKKGQDVSVLPSGKTSLIKKIETAQGELEEAFAGQAVVLTLSNELDISRGDMIIRSGNIPEVGNQFEAILCWMDEKPLSQDGFYYLKHTTRYTKAFILGLPYKIDVNTLHRKNTATLKLNEIGKAHIKTAEKLFFDPFKLNRETGSFILIDPVSNNTVAAGMIRRVFRKLQSNVSIERIKQTAPSNIYWEGGNIPREEWEERNRHKAAVLWFTGLSGSGKSTIAKRLVHFLFEHGCRVFMLDGDNLRHGLCGDLGFSSKDREENIRRAGELAGLLYNQGNIVICTFISPFIRSRQVARVLIPEGFFIEIYLKCDIKVCKDRDPKDLYKKAAKGEIENFTGISSPYEEPLNPEIILKTDKMSVDESIHEIVNYLLKKGIIQNLN